VSTQNGNPHTRLAFDREGLLYLAVSHHNQDRYAQDLNSHGGKVLRLRDDGTPASGNPFIGVVDRRPEVFTYGHRALHGIAVHPDTGEVWINEHGDEVNILKAGSNYGWPFVGLMGLGGGNPTPPAPRGLMLTEPYLSWVPALNISGMMFYTADKFPKWKGNLIVGGLASGQVHRVAFRTTPKSDEAAFTQIREALFTGIGQRVRDVRQGPDGLIYFVAYDDKSGTVRRIEPAS
jgi:glucose/arabinose dehydrogenase